MEVLLISPRRDPAVRGDRKSLPISLLYLAGALREAGHGVRLVDFGASDEQAGPALDEEVAAMVEDLRPGLVGIGCFTSTVFQEVLHIARCVREASPEAPIAIGGVHPTLYHREILLNCGDIGYVALGEGETQVVALAEALESGRLDLLRHVGALAWRGPDGEVLVNPRGGYVKDVDELPPPAWDLVDFGRYRGDLSSYHNPKGKEITVATPILSSRSCPFDCPYCLGFRTMGRGFRKRSYENVVDEIEMLYTEHGLDYFTFIDHIMNFDKRRTVEMCNEICRRGIDIQFATEAGLHLPSLDQEVVDAMVEAGLVHARLPIEHGNDRIRNEVIGKRLSREKIHEVCASLRKHDVLLMGMFIMGFPEDTCATLEETYQLILDLRLDINSVFNLMPFPGTETFETAAREGLLLFDSRPEQQWRGTTALSPAGDFYVKPRAMSLAELQEFRDRFDSVRVLSDRAKELNPPGRFAETT